MFLRPGSELYLLRHGETEWNVAGRLQGAADSPLTARGIAQAEAFGRRLAATTGKVDAMFASPLGRTRQTCAIIRSFASYPAVLWDERLREVALGSWEGLTHDDIDARWPDSLEGSSPFDWFFRSPDGESYASAAARIEPWLSEIEGVVVAISHGLSSRIIRGAYLDLPTEEALELPIPQDTIWHLKDGRITAITA